MFLSCFDYIDLQLQDLLEDYPQALYRPPSKNPRNQQRPTRNFSCEASSVKTAGHAPNALDLITRSRLEVPASSVYPTRYPTANLVTNATAAEHPLNPVVWTSQTIFFIFMVIDLFITSSFIRHLDNFAQRQTFLCENCDASTSWKNHLICAWRRSLLQILSPLSQLAKSGHSEISAIQANIDKVAKRNVL